MADVNRGNRPLSPHLEIYRPQMTSMLSIVHRITGCGLLVAACMIVCWFMGAAGGAESFAASDGWITSFLGDFILFFSVIALWYHACNGIRHLVWDTGRGLEMEQAELGGKIVIGATAVLSIITLVVA